MPVIHNPTKFHENSANGQMDRKGENMTFLAELTISVLETVRDCYILLAIFQESP